MATTAKASKAPTRGRQFMGVAIRTHGELETRLDRLALALAKLAKGVPHSRARIARACLERGLASFEAEIS